MQKNKVFLACCIALVAGVLQAWSIADPLNGQALWWLQIASLAVLVALLQRCASPRQAALVAWVFTTAWLCATVWWLFISMHVYGGLHPALAVLAIFALCGFLALYYAAAAYVFKLLVQKKPIAAINTAKFAILFGACWLLPELARDTWFTGFPWGAGGYAHVDAPYANVASLIGVYGLGFMGAMLAAALARLLGPGRSRGAFSTIAIVLMLGVGAGTWISRSANIAPSTPVSITLLQANIPQAEKFDPATGVRESLERYLKGLSDATTTMVVTPETAVPLLKRQLPDGYWDKLTTRFQNGQQAALVGIPLGDMQSGYTNSMLGLSPRQEEPYSYSKHHLVPFGEFTPGIFKWFTAMMNIPLGDFERGAVAQPSFEWALQRWAPNICYEDLFGDELAARFVNEDKAPTVMVNASNIGWFGNSIAIDQHLQISRMRAIELRRPMVRATNTGATVIIDHRGRVTHSLPRHTQGALVGTVQGRSEITPHAWWAGRWGLLPLWIWGLMILACFAIRGTRNTA